MKHFGYGEQDWIRCEVCSRTAVDIHHIIFRSHGGTDRIENVMALCRDCHNKAHDGILVRAYLQDIHNKFIANYGQARCSN